LVAIRPWLGIRILLGAGAFGAWHLMVERGFVSTIITSEVRVLDLVVCGVDGS
jgi:hypothetical protein